MRKFLLSMALVLLTGATMAQGTNDGRLTADDLNAKTEKTAILIKCTQETNYTTYYNPTGRGALGENSIVYWVPAGEGAFYITKGDGENDYMQTSGITAFGSQATAAKFYAVKPYGTGSGVESFAGANCYEDEATGGEYWVRLAFTDNSKWFNFNGNTYNTGTGVWTVQNIYEVVTITYNIKYNDATRLTVKTAGIVGNDFPEIPASSLPLGVTVTKPEGKVSAEGTFDLEATVSVPFEYADSYENITHWYYMTIKPGAVDYLYHEAGQTNIPLSQSTKPAAEAKYAWAFVGDPFDGYRIYNYAAGADMVLSSSTTMAGTNGGGTYPVMTALPVADGNNELWIATASSHGTNGFFLAQKGFANNRMNNRDDKLAYWTGGADAGSTFQVERCIVPDGYYRIAYDNSGTEYYLQGVASSVKGCAFTTATGAESVWYYGGGKLLSYTAGKYIKEDGNTRGLQGIGVDGGAVTIAASSRDASKYTIACTSYLHFNTSGSNYFSDHCDTDGTHSTHDMILKNVMSLPVTISAAGYATFYAPVAVRVPAGVTAHAVTINGEWAILSEALEVVPANTAVVLAGDADTYNFTITTADAFNGTNALRGSAPATYYTEAGTYYALAQVDGVVGFYKDEFNNSRFQNNSHKAYLYVAEGSANVASYSFRFGEGTTGISEVKGESGNVKGIYDLTGRKVEEITAPGIYIVGGKKVLVK